MISKCKMKKKLILSLEDGIKVIIYLMESLMIKLKMFSMLLEKDGILYTKSKFIDK